MPPDSLSEFLKEFQTRRMAKHQTTNKRKADSPPPQSPQEPSRVFPSIENSDPPNMVFDIGKSDPCSDDVPGPDPDPEVEATSTDPNTPVAEKSSQNDGSTFKPKRTKPNTLENAAQCAKITADSERAREEIEAAGIHVKDFATGYDTIVTDRVEES